MKSLQGRFSYFVQIAKPNLDMITFRLPEILPRYF